MNKIIKKGAIVKKIKCLAAAAAILLGLTGCEQGRIQEKGYLRAAAVTENNDTFLTLGLFSQERTVTASGENIASARDSAELMTGQEIFTGYTELLIVDGEDCREILGYMLNEWRVSPSCMVVYSSNGSALMKELGAEQLIGMTEQAVKQGRAPKCDLITVLTELCSSGSAEVAELAPDGSAGSHVIY